MEYGGTSLYLMVLILLFLISPRRLTEALSEITSNSEHRFILDSNTKTALEKHVEEYHSQRSIF